MTLSRWRAVGRLPAGHLPGVFVHDITNLVLEICSFDPVHHLIVEHSSKSEDEDGECDAGDHGDHRHPHPHVEGGEDGEEPGDEERQEYGEETVACSSQGPDQQTNQGNITNKLFRLSLEGIIALLP